MVMKTFRVIDRETGRDVGSKILEKIAKDNHLMDMDIDQFFIGEDGQLILTDDCGRMAYCDEKELGLFPVFNGKYPDLDYLEALFASNLAHLYPEQFPSAPRVELLKMFPQTWSNTAGGFSEPGTVSGQAFVTQITTVFTYRNKTDSPYYGVFFDNEPAYIIEKANHAFLSDLKKQRLRSQYEARKAY